MNFGEDSIQNIGEAEKQIIYDSIFHWYYHLIDLKKKSKCMTNGEKWFAEVWQERLDTLEKWIGEIREAWDVIH